MEDDREEKIHQIVTLISMVLEDMSVPRNVKRAMEDARRRLNAKEDPVVRAGGAIYSLEGLSEDVNLPPHARTQIWQILSALESITE